MTVCECVCTQGEFVYLYQGACVGGWGRADLCPVAAPVTVWSWKAEVLGLHCSRIPRISPPTYTVPFVP